MSSAVEVVEWFIEAKGDSSRCEDGIVRGEHFTAVIDGASSLADGHPTSGQLARDVISEAVGLLDPMVTARVAVDALSLAVAAVRVDNSSAAVAILSHERRETWVVGDCVAVDTRLADGSLIPPKPIDVLCADVRAAALELTSALTQMPSSADDPGRAVIRPILEQQVELRNSVGAWSYGAIDGTHVPDALIEITSLATDTTEVVLHSDGYPWSLPTLSEAETRLEAALASDPWCVGTLRGTKPVIGNSFDDRAYVRVRLK